MSILKNHSLIHMSHHTEVYTKKSSIYFYVCVLRTNRELKLSESQNKCFLNNAQLRTFFLLCTHFSVQNQKRKQWTKELRGFTWKMIELQKQKKSLTDYKQKKIGRNMGSTTHGLNSICKYSFKEIFKVCIHLRMGRE